MEIYKDMKGAITCLDVLGWKGIWKIKTDAIKKLLDIIKDLQEIGSDFQKALSNLNHLRDLNTLEIEIKAISDTIVVYTYGESYLSLLLHGIIISWVIPKSIREGIPIRGATTYGVFETEENIILGPAIDEVASWYEIADWIGVILTPSAFLTTQLSNFYESSEHKATFYDYFCKYDVPLKKGKLKTLCANWPQNYKDEGAMLAWESKDDLLKKFIEMGPLAPEIASKYINTLAFYEERDNHGCHL